MRIVAALGGNALLAGQAGSLICPTE